MTTEAPAGTVAGDQITREELQLATRNHGMPLEAMRYDVTPIGLHYLLVHYDIPFVDGEAWHLDVDGDVERPLRLTIDDLRSRETETRPVTMECAGNGRAQLSPRALSQPWLVEAIGTGEWTGTPLWPVLEDAGLSPDVVDIVFVGLDSGVEGAAAQHYQRSLTPQEAREEGALLVYELNGVPLPPQHGYPLRLLVPGWYGMTSVKWLSRITASNTLFAGYQQERAYRLRHDADEVGEPLTRMRVRSLMVPPGVPDFFTRERFVRPGPVTLTGRAWSGAGTISRVQVSADGGSTWTDADVDDAAVPYAWQEWRLRWDAQVGTHDLISRATDSTGATQPLAAEWNLGGYAVNSVQHVTVTVTDAPPGI